MWLRTSCTEFELYLRTFDFKKLRILSLHSPKVLFKINFTSLLDANLIDPFEQNPGTVQVDKMLKSVLSQISTVAVFPLLDYFVFIILNYTNYDPKVFI